MEPGICPKCGNDDLDYHNKPEMDGGISMSYRVGCPICKWVGYEVYAIEFTHFAELDRTHTEEEGDG